MSINNFSLVVREPNIVFDSLTAFCVKDSLFFSALINTFSAFIVYSEKDLNFTAVKSLDKVTDFFLKNNIEKFIMQETSHSKLHNLYNSQLGKIGYAHEIKKIQNFKNHLSFVKLFRKSDRFLVSCAAAGEQYTKLLGLWGLSIKNGLFSDACAESLFRWHAAEEVEHYHITYEIALNLKATYFHRLFGFIFETIFLQFILAYGVFLFLKKDGNILKMSVYEDLFNFIFTKKYSDKRLIGLLIGMFIDNLNPLYKPKNTYVKISNDYYAGANLSAVVME